ncbi:MAG: hypothetical protein A3F72_03700 [Bacteroidetes bacterium RIFCSPLOWO2_12_FULL_35_15]|nr:MAG: hypothetical protein A3F72_03700 [Bacteroidetes bacterium RIFCSPLOWO2_12_FULL_35_15]
MKSDEKYFKMEFDDNDNIVLEKVNEENGVAKFRAIRHYYDLETDEVQKLIVVVEVSPLTDIQRIKETLYQKYYGKQHPSP